MLLSFLTHFGYLAIAGLLVAGGVGVPVPEELVQLSAGYLARRGIIAFAPALACAYLGIVTGDVLLFRLAKRTGGAILSRPSVARVLTPARRARLERHFARHGFLTILVARHLSGLRVAAFALAGASGQVATRTFVLADALSALISVPLVVSLGYLFAARLEDVKRRVHEVELVLLAVVVLLVVAWLVFQRIRARSAVAAPGHE